MTGSNPDGFKPLFSEINPLYASSEDTPNIISIHVRMRDGIDGTVLKRAVDVGMNRYPYFRVTLCRRDGQWGLTENRRPIVVSQSNVGPALLSEASNHHLIAFSWHEDWLILNVSHALTDGTGAYEVLRTVLYYYCSWRYGAELRRDGIRLVEDSISPEEYDDPAPRITKEPPADTGEASLPALNPVILSNLKDNTTKTVFSVSLSETGFMRFNTGRDGSPATMIALFLSRAIAGLHPDCPNPIRISLCVNQRKALGAPLAHQSLVGGAWLEYKEKMRSWPLEKQATVYRGMVFLQTMDERVLEGMTYINRNTRRLLSIASDEARAAEAKKNSDDLKRALTATVSYVGQGNLGDAERYIRDFHTWANAMNENILIEVSAINGRFILDFSQNFSSPIYWKAFLGQLEENGIPYETQPAVPLRLPEIHLPWIKKRTY